MTMGLPAPVLIPRIPRIRQLTDDMKVATLIEELEALTFYGEPCQLRIDRGACDYIVQALKRR